MRELTQVELTEVSGGTRAIALGVAAAATYDALKAAGRAIADTVSESLNPPPCGGQVCGGGGGGGR